MKHARTATLGLLLLAVATTGCRSQRKPILEHTGTIPIKVWVVLGPGEVVGELDNRGCRLTAQEITDRIEQLQYNAVFYGQNVTFQWQPAAPTQAEDPALLPFMPRTRESPIWHQTFVSNYWQSDHLNIYFVGNVQHSTSDPDEVAGLALDPANAQGQTPESPWILLNDGGFEEDWGFYFNWDPALALTYNVLEHEMVHYLARFTNRTFGQAPNQRTYDSGEHVPEGSFNILSEGPLPPGYPLAFPGRWNKPGTENQEIWDRIWSGNWNYP